MSYIERITNRLYLGNQFCTIMTKRSSLLSILLFPLISTFTLIYSCGPVEETPEPDETTATVTGYATDVINHTHIIDTDPCPQPVTTKLQIFCHKDDEFTTCSADSVSIEGRTDGLNISFINGLKYVRLSTSGAPTVATLEFTCGIPESFTQIYKLNLFKNGNLVDTENVEVVVTVK